MTIQTLRVNELPPTLNKLNNIHYMQRAKMKEHWCSLVAHACRDYNIQPIERASITLELYFPDKRRRDLDNYGGLGFKFAIDGLVSAGILTDDSVNEVVELRLIYGGISKPPHILVHLRSV